MKLASLAPGSVIRFAPTCPLPGLSDSKAVIQSVRTYRFGEDSTVSYQLSADGQVFFMTIAEDAQGFYLALSRELDATEQDRWFGRDALSFFTEASSAKTIRCKADLVIEGDWAAARYSKTVDWAEGSIMQGRSSIGGVKQVRPFRYNLLVDESGEKALEIEHYEDTTGENKVLITVYRPAEDIQSIAEEVPHIPAPKPPTTTPAFKPALAVEENTKAQTAALNINGHSKAVEEPPLFESMLQKPDFRRQSEETSPIRVARNLPTEVTESQNDLPPLPSFLMSRDNSYLSLDEIITPETERVRCDLKTAKTLIDTAVTRGVRVRDVMRELLGLENQLADEAMFELPLTEDDYRTLAMRYKVKPDHRLEIRLRLQEELQRKLLAIAKR